MLNSQEKDSAAHGRSIFLDYANVSIPSQAALDALSAYIGILQRPFDYSQHLAFIASFKARAGKLLQVATDETVVPIPSTAFGLCAIAQSLPLRRFDNLVVYSEEYPANYYPWTLLAYDGVQVRSVPPNRHGGIRVDDLAGFVDARTRAIVVSSVQFSTGHRTDLAALGQYCKERDVFLVVDAIQSAGVLPLHPESLGVHALAVGSQKWLLAPHGSGFMYLSPQLSERLDPTGPIGAYSVTNPSEYLPHHFSLRPGVERFELGSGPTIVHRALYASMGILLEKGIDNVASDAMRLSRTLVEDLKRRGIEVLGSDDWHERSPITAFRPPDPEQVKRRLRDAGIVVTHRDGQIRVSPHFHNSEDDVLAIGDALGHA